MESRHASQCGAQHTLHTHSTHRTHSTHSIHDGPYMMLPRGLDLNWNGVWRRQQHKDIIGNRCTSTRSSDSLARIHTKSWRMVYAADDRSNPASTTDASTYTVPYNVYGCAHTIFVPNKCLIASLVRGAHKLMKYFQRRGQNLSHAYSHHERDVVNAKVCFGSTLCLRMQRSSKRCGACEVVFGFYTLSILLKSLAYSQSVS